MAHCSDDALVSEVWQRIEYGMRAHQYQQLRTQRQDPLAREWGESAWAGVLVLVPIG